MKTLDRYVIRETVVPFLLALGVFTFILAISPMMDSAEEFLKKGVEAKTIAYLLATLLPQALGVTLPMAFLMGLLIALGRLSSDRETVALLACGVSLWRLLRPVLLMSVFVGLATLYMMIEGIPAGNRAFVQITTNLLAQQSSQEIRPGRFYEGFPGKVLYIAAERADGRWAQVMLALTRESGAPTLIVADEGQLVMDQAAGRVEIVLTGVTKYMPGAEAGVYDISPAQNEQYFVDASEVWRRFQVVPGIREMTLDELRIEEADKIRIGESPHPVIIARHQKFSFPVACVVMALLGLALGVHTRKDGKFASFALGLAVIFVYYTVMILFEALAKGQRFPAEWARWMPNLLLGPGAIALIWWRSANAERGIPLRVPAAIAARLSPQEETAGTTQAGRRGSGPVVVLRLPRLGFPRPSLIDLYLIRRYISVISLAFSGLLGLFYIGTVIDLSDKIFKGSATLEMLLQYLWYSTPQFVYFLIPIAVLVAVLVTIGTLSKTSELTVLRACGVSLYRLAVPLLLFGAVWSAVLFTLDERVLAASNRKRIALENIIKDRPSSVVDIANRHWLVGTEGRVYYYEAYDASKRAFVGLSVFDVTREPYRVSQHTFVERAAFGRSTWSGGPGWVQLFPAEGRSVREDFRSRTLKLDAAKYFESEQADSQAMTVKQLSQYVAKLKASGLNVGSYDVDLHRKVAFPLMTIVMTLIALPFAVTTGKRGALYGVGLGIALAFAYQIAFTAFGFLGAAELLPAVLAAWAPNLLFLAGASYLLLTVRT